jgi:hypothetical protein
MEPGRREMIEFVAIILSHFFLLTIILRSVQLSREEESAEAMPTPKK